MYLFLHFNLYPFIHPLLFVLPDKVILLESAMRQKMDDMQKELDRLKADARGIVARTAGMCTPQYRTFWLSFAIFDFQPQCRDMAGVEGVG